MESTEFLEKIVPLVNSEPLVTINFLKSKGLLSTNMMCKYCDNLMKWSKFSGNGDGFRWKCLARKCIKYKTTLSLRTYSCFVDIRSDIRRILLAIYFWSKEISQKDACKLAGLSKPTMIIIYGFLRNICKKHFEVNPIKLGGRGVICQINESVFSYEPRKNKGTCQKEAKERRIFGIVDTSDIPLTGYMQFVKSKDTDTLLPIIKNICLPGSIIVTDTGRIYPGSLENGNNFLSLNNTENFLDSINGVDIEDVESYWRPHKLRIKKLKGIFNDYKEEYLWEFMWRDRFYDNSFENILKHIQLYFVSDSILREE